MADNGGFGAEQGSTTSFSQLFSDDVVLGLDFNNSYSCSSGHEKPPKMLCFGDYNQQNVGQIVVYGETTTNGTAAVTQKSGITCSDSSSASSGNNSSSAIAHSKSTKKRNGSGQESVPCPNLATTTTQVAGQRSSKKTKAGDNPSSSTGHARAKKEKLGDRITALQQLVSPFGKTDTASVLYEAMGYIRFLHDQVQILCSPYLQHHIPEGEESRKDLQSRGLYLVPVADSVHVANSNGADFWSRAMGSNISPSASVAAAATIAKQQQQQLK